MPLVREVEEGDILSDEQIKELRFQHVRIGPVHALYTQDYNIHRLNIRYDEDKRVVRIFNG